MLANKLGANVTIFLFAKPTCLRMLMLLSLQKYLKSLRLKNRKFGVLYHSYGSSLVTGTLPKTEI